MRDFPPEKNTKISHFGSGSCFLGHISGDNVVVHNFSFSDKTELEYMSFRLVIVISGNRINFVNAHSFHQLV